MTPDQQKFDFDTPRPGGTLTHPALPSRFAAWFTSREWRPRPHQLEVLDGVSAGSHVLLVAPTGGGKTLAGFLPSLIDLADGDNEGLHTLYISPLKALAVDVARNVSAPIKEMDLPIRTETRSGDTPMARKQRQRRDPPHILLTTPESLSLMLSYSDAAEVFKSLKRIIIDEIHAFAPTKRGQLLSLALARLNRLSPDARRIGLSATIRDVDAYRRWMAPLADASKVRLVRGQGGAAPQIEILVPEERVPWRGHTGRHALKSVYDLIKAHRTSLLFVNTRSIAERVFQDLWALNDDDLPIGLHHGSLDAQQRRKVEAAMARGDLRAVVATSSLDLGIDWGDVDLVVQIGAPKGASRMLQRIGRANHRLDEPSKAVLVPGNRFEYLEAQAALDAMLAGELDGDNFADGGLDVLAQHIMGMACSRPFCAAELFEEVREAAPYLELSRSDFDDALAYVMSGGYALRRYNRYRRLIRDDDGRYRTVSRKIDHQYRLNAGTIVTAPMLDVRFKRGGSLGQVEEWFALGLTPGDSFMFAGRLLCFEGIEKQALLVSAPKTTGEPKVPVYGGSRMPLTTNLASRVRAMLADPACWNRFPSDVQDWLKIQQWKSVLPNPNNLLVETFPREGPTGLRHYLVAYCFEGRLAHQSLGMLMTRKMEKLGQNPMGFVATDYVIATWSRDPVPDPAALFTTDMMEEELLDWMAESSLLRRTFREVGTIAGLLEQKYPGQEKNGRQMSVSADLIYDVLRKYDPEHVLLRATWQEAATRLADLDRLRTFLQRISGRVHHQRLDQVSPLAVPILLEIGRESVSGEATDALIGDATALIEEAMAV